MDTDNIQEDSKPQPEEIKELLNDEGMETETTADAQLSTSPTPAAEGQAARGLEFLYDVPLQISVEVGRCKILLKDLLKMGEGYVIGRTTGDTEAGAHGPGEIRRAGRQRVAGP